VPKAVPIRRSLAYTLFLIVALVAGGLLATMAYRGTRIQRGVCRALIADEVRRVEERARRLIEPAERGLAVAVQLGEKGRLDPKDPAELRAIFGPWLGSSDHIAGVVIADEPGNAFMLTRRGSDWIVRETRPGPGGLTSRRLVYRDLDSDPIEVRDVPDYDPRRRAWYSAALQNKPGEVAWTKLYDFFDSKEAGSSVVTRFACDGVIHVIAFDVTMRHVLEFMREESPAGLHVFMLADNEPLRVAGLELPMAVEDALAATETAELKAFESGGERWWADREAIRIGRREGVLLVVVPERVLIPDLLTERLAAVLTVIVVLLVGFLAITRFARRFSKPVEALVRNFEYISRGHLERAEPVRTQIAELQRVANAQDHMREALRSLDKLEGDLAIARRIQQDTWPARLPDLPGYQLAAISLPAEDTGGDSYDAFGIRASDAGDWELVEGRASHAGLMLADATGHGVGPALSVAQVRAVVRVGVLSRATIDMIARHMNDLLCADLTGGRFITVWMAHLDAEAHTIRGFAAGQAPLMHYVAARDEFTVLPADAPPFGIVPHLAINVPEPIPLGRGDFFVVLSDGFYEAPAPGGDRFGEERVKKLVREHRRGTPEVLLEALRTEVSRFTEGAPPADDQTAVIVKRS
jgi:serine phosphatase RsbU (regulator of sigma subunit)